MVAAIDKVVMTPRALYDYKNMFLLTDEELRNGTILDCPAGASPFGAQVRARGGRVVSADLAYDVPRPELTDKIRSDLARLWSWVEAADEVIDWSYLGSPDALYSHWEVAVDLFLTDFALDGERYVTVTLPELPFPDKHFSLVVSSHGLFTFPQFISYEDHLESLREMVRVSAGEVRLFPIADTTSTVYPRLGELRDALLESGIRSEIRKAACSYNKGVDQLLVLWRA